MKLKILSLMLVLMLVLFPVTHVMAMPIQDDCQKAFTEEDLKTYIRNHEKAGHHDHEAFIDIVRGDFDPKKECLNPKHDHKQLMKTIGIREIWKVRYHCLDSKGDKWYIGIDGAIGELQGWHDYIPDPCAKPHFSGIYNLNRIDRNDLLLLFNLMISIDQYLDQTCESKIIQDLAGDFIGGTSTIAGALYSLARYGGRIPYIGEAIFVGVGVASAVYTLVKVYTEIHKGVALGKQTIIAAKNIVRANPIYLRDGRSFPTIR